VAHSLPVSRLIGDAGKIPDMYPDMESFQRLDKFPVIADCVFVSLMLSKGGARRSVLINLAKMGIA